MHKTISNALVVLTKQVTDGHRHISSGTDELILAAAEELRLSKARVAELEDKETIARLLLRALRERDAAQTRVADLESHEGVIGRDAKPGTGKNYESVEIYCQTQSSEMRPGRWSGWPPYAIEDWHLWRPSYRPRAALIDRSAAIREELGVVELEGNGFYVLPDQREKGEPDG